MFLAVQDSVSVVLMGGWLFWQRACGRPLLPPRGRWLAALVLVGASSQLLGNLPVMWAMSVVGLALTIPLAMSVSLAAAAICGRAVLRERVSWRSPAAMGIVMVSVVLLGLAGRDANVATASTEYETTAAWWTLAAIAAAGMAGVTYGVLSVATRKLLLAGTANAAVLFVIPTVGVALTAPLGFYRQACAGFRPNLRGRRRRHAGRGPAQPARLHGRPPGPAADERGACQPARASQVAMAAVAGFLFFAEPASLALVLGVVLTIVGMVLLDPPPATRVPPAFQPLQDG